MALAANAAYAFVWFSEIHYRTHILSRVWASMAIGILAGWVAAAGRGQGRACRPGLRWAAAAVVTAFVFFGTWGESSARISFSPAGAGISASLHRFWMQPLRFVPELR